jgi:hypothetical protein
MSEMRTVGETSIEEGEIFNADARIAVKMRSSGEKYSYTLI